MTPRRRASALGLALSLASSGCGAPDYGEAYLASFRAGLRAQSAGRFAEASDAFARAAERARRRKDRDEASFLVARSLERAGRMHEARAAYLALVEMSPDGPRAGRAAFEAASIDIAHGEADRGWAALRRTLERHPDHGVASRHLTQWAEHTAETRGERALRQALRSWRALRDTALWPQVHYERARSFEREGEIQAARDAYLFTARLRRHPRGSLTDDAYFHAARLARAGGDDGWALQTLEEMLEGRETSVTGGSYVRPRFPAAQFAVATIYRDARDDPTRARAAFRKTRLAFPDSVLADDAAWQEARMARREGDLEGACGILRDLVAGWPRSRYRRCLFRLCPELAAATPAPRRCPAYIERELDP
ncbi:MAG: tetratricopeptide repeat protein [Myxococcota bacterium]